MRNHIFTNEEQEEASAALTKAEEALPYSVRTVEGDASETGLIRFAQLINDIDTERASQPIFAYQKNGKTVETKIPFSSETKFNLFVRDMNPSQKDPDNAEDNLTVVMKGAPERIINRCSTILVQGEEKPFDQGAKDAVNGANESLGKLGERVLALAICKLDPSVYSKSPAYEFDIETWKTW